MSGSRLALAKAEAVIMAEVAKQMEAKATGCTILIGSGCGSSSGSSSVGAGANAVHFEADPSVQDMIVKRLRMVNSDWPTVKIDGGTKLVLRWPKN